MGAVVFPSPNTGPAYTSIRVPKYSPVTATASVPTLAAGAYKLSFGAPTLSASGSTINIGPISLEVGASLPEVFSLGSSTSSVTMAVNPNVGVWNETSGVEPGSNSGSNQILHDGSSFISLGQDNNVYSTTDGVSWTKLTSAAVASNTYAIAFSSATTQKYIVSSLSGGIHSSTNGITWTSRTSNTTNVLYSAAGSPTATEKFIAGGSGGTLRSSTDGITWTTRTHGFSTNTITCAAWGSNIYLMGAATVLQTSTDGITWTTRTAGISGSIESISYQNSLYFYYDNNRGYGVSTDAITWTRYNAAWTSSGGGIVPNVVWLSPYYYTVGGAYAIYRTTSISSGWTQQGFSDITPGNLASNGSRIVTTNGYYTTNGDLLTNANIDIVLEYTGTATTAS